MIEFQEDGLSGKVKLRKRFFDKQYTIKLKSEMVAKLEEEFGELFQKPKELYSQEELEVTVVRASISKWEYISLEDERKQPCIWLHSEINLIELKAKEGNIRLKVTGVKIKDNILLQKFFEELTGGF